MGILTQDTNFGLTFSIWDHLFGTQYRGYDEYPETGVADAPMPTFLSQLFYPFNKVAVGRRGGGPRLSAP